MEKLDSISIRILGALIEKESTTPDQYPLTLNALLNACNQKTSRDPVMALTVSDIGPRLNELEQAQWLSREFGSRAEKYKHCVNIKLDLTRKKMAILGTLILRGPQTMGELRSHSTRLHEFESIEAVQYSLNQLIEREEPLCKLLPRSPGESADRYQQLLSPLMIVSPHPNLAHSSAPVTTNLEQRLDELEQRILQIENRISKTLTGTSD